VLSVEAPGAAIAGDECNRWRDGNESEPASILEAELAVARQDLAAAHATIEELRNHNEDLAAILERVLTSGEAVAEQIEIGIDFTG